MTALISQIINKYKGMASKEVILAVENAAAKTGVDFSFLMEKAATESGFDPAAQSKSSSAAGLYQFIESTWLQMVKEYGPKYGLGNLAGQIKVRDGKPCVDDCASREAILGLRKNPEIAALMAGEFSAGNKQYLEAHTGGGVGTTELYFAHFMGPGGAAKFLNSRAQNGSVIAASVFPKEANANKNVFFDPATGCARTLNGVYDFFAKKFGGGTAPSSPAPSSPASAVAPPVLAVAPVLSAPPPADITPLLAAFDDENKIDAIDWNDPADLLRLSSLTPHKLSAEAILLLAQTHRREEDPLYNS
ncbi:MAG: transglycosylase SLT domain-containing protein [Alphaproteobacteria bacterium]|nr:transglycosylase SLT domain-containing protein [Alphaproteobacteria bacterium]